MYTIIKNLCIRLKSLWISVFSHVEKCRQVFQKGPFPSRLYRKTELTKILVNVTIKNDKYSCHFAKENSQKWLEGQIMRLNNRLKEHRARLGVNQQDFGRMTGVSRQTISLIERGDYSPSVTLALKIAKVLDVSVEDVFYLTGGKNDEG